MLVRNLPTLGGLDRIGWTQHLHVRHGTQRCQDLDRLIGRKLQASQALMRAASALRLMP